VGEFQQICAKHGITADEASEFLRALSDATVVATFKCAKDHVYLQPEKLAAASSHILDASGEGQQRAIEQKQAKIKEYQTELDSLQVTMNQIVQKSERSANFKVWGLAAAMFTQVSLVARLTWWELSWDIMEPVTYILTYSTSILTILYFGATRRDYTYETFWERLAHKKRDKLIRRSGFDLPRYEHLKSEIKKLNDEISQLTGVYGLPPHVNSADLKVPKN
jgi:calcium uniporter protein, mitochondrial